MNKKERNNLYQDYLIDLMRDSLLSENTSIDNIESKIRKAEVVIEDADEPFVNDGKIVLPRGNFEGVNSKEDLDTLCEDFKNLYQMLYGGMQFVTSRNESTFLEKQLKKSISKYLTVKSMDSEVSKKSYADVEFSVLSPYSTILDNLIAELALIIGDRQMVTSALCNGFRHLKNSIDLASGKENLSNKFIAKFEQLAQLCENYDALERIVLLNNRMNSKLGNIARLVKDNRTYQFELLSANMLEKNNFDLGRTFIKDEIDPSLELNDMDKRTINIYLKEFIGHHDFCTLETKHYSTRFNDLTFIDKINLVLTNYQNLHEDFKYRILKCWQALQKIILEIAIEAHKRGFVVNFDELVRLGSYECDVSFDLGQSHKMKVFNKKNKKNNI